MSGSLEWLGVVFGPIAAVLGWLLRSPTEADERRRARVLATPTSRISDIAAEGVVEVRGRVVMLGGEPPLIAPFSQRRVVWVLSDVSETVGKGDGVRATLLQEIHCRSFLLDDGSTERARVVLRSHATVVESGADPVLVHTQRPGDPAPPHVLSFLERKNILPRHGGRERRMSFYETTIAEGDEIFVNGPATRERLQPGEAYRNEAPTRLLIAGTGPDADVVATKLAEKQLLARFRQFRTTGWVMFVVGMAATILAVFRLVTR
jgi:hypothetical protein